ncbi:MAG: sigma 54-interacting transcriptional regulator [Holophagaceae bacterium]|nr:sigma 54-interacting transcriptional regulator [Holophagaceae bacterium]
MPFPCRWTWLSNWARVAATLALALVPALAESGHGTRPKAPRKTAVVLYSLPQDVPGLRELSGAITEGLQKDSPDPLDVYSEYTGLDRFASPTYDASLLTLYNEKYAARKVDLLVVVGPTALEFVLSKKFLPGTPIVTCYIARRFVEAARLRRPDLTGALPANNAPRTIEMMLAMFPQTRRIQVVLGASDYERNQAEMGRIIFSSFSGRIGLEYLNDLTLEQIQTKVRALPDDDLVLFGSLLKDAGGREFYTNEALSAISAASRRPVFGLLTEDLGDGILGGVLLSMELSGRDSAQLGRRILQGESAAAIPLVADAGMAPMFDWRQVRRWGLRENQLPPGTLLRFKKVSLWDAYWKEISLGLGVILLETLLVTGLIIQLRRRKRIERELADAETRYRTVADFTHDWEFWQRPDGGFDYLSPACARVSGFAPEAFRAEPSLFAELVVEEDRPAWTAHQAEALGAKEPAALEYRIHNQAGELRWVEQTNNPVRFEGGHSAGTRGSIRDITARKQGELELKQAYQEIGVLKDQLEAENTYYREKIQAVEGSSELIGQSDPMKYLLFRIRQVAPSETTVLIQGETGTGKELVAEAIHHLGPRKDRTLVKVNCAALPPGLAESELFGHERGAFTGAQTLRKGRFELADGATLFLDEVGELSPDVQAKLLRVLQDGQYQRVGGTRTLQADVRVVAATNRDLAKEVAKGRFREDLWYRLNVFPISVPPLRQRKEDIPMLAQFFLDRFCQKLGRSPLDLPRSVVQALQAYGWPGNVRELQNLIEQAVLVSEGPMLRLPDRLGPAPSGPVGSGLLPGLVEVEREHIVKVLDATNWKVEGAKGAADILGLAPSTLRSRMQKLGIERRED